MRNRSYAVLVAVVTLVACADPTPSEPPVEPSRSAPQAVASFTAEFTPPVRGPGLGGTPGRAVFEVVPIGSGGGTTRNPANTIQLISSGPFLVTDAGTGGNLCETRYIGAPVEITNFFPERLTNLYVQFSWIGPNSHDLCTLDPAPGPSQGVDPPADRLGNIRYLPDLGTLLGSIQTPDDVACTGCVVPGEFGSEIWAFDYFTEDATFTVAGNVYAEVYPERAIPVGPTEQVPGNWGASMQVGANDVTEFWTRDGTDADDRPQALELKLETCELDGGGACASPSTSILPRETRRSRRSVFAKSLAGLTAGSTYRVRGWNRFDPDNQAPVVLVDGSQMMEETFVAVGEPGNLSPLDGAGFGDGDVMTWTVDAPDPVRDYPAEWAHRGIEICNDPPPLDPKVNCTDVGLIFTGAYLLPPDFITLAFDQFLSAVASGSTFTYTFAPDYQAWSEPAPGSLHRWRVRNQFADGRAAWWTPAREVIFGNKPTGLSGTTTLSFTVAPTNLVGAQVQICSDAACTSAGPPSAASLLTGNVYTFDASAQTPPFWWRSRVTYAAGGGPWSGIASVP